MTATALAQRLHDLFEASPSEERHAVALVGDVCFSAAGPYFWLRGHDGSLYSVAVTSLEEVAKGTTRDE